MNPFQHVSELNYGLWRSFKHFCSSRLNIFSVIHLLCSLTLTISTHCSNLGLKDGAISLDGGIIRGNDAVYLGCLFQQVKSSISMPLHWNFPQFDLDRTFSFRNASSLLNIWSILIIFHLYIILYALVFSFHTLGFSSFLGLLFPPLRCFLPWSK